MVSARHVEEVRILRITLGVLISSLALVMTACASAPEPEPVVTVPPGFAFENHYLPDVWVSMSRVRLCGRGC